MYQIINRGIMQSTHFRGIFTRNLLTNVSKILVLPTSFFSSQTRPEDNARESTLSRDLYAKIKACGPITIADYMKEVLTHPTKGYYMNRDVFGTDGDFVTSPEITQLFGEMIGIWVIHELTKISRDSFQLVELGPGRGTLSKDILKVFKQLKMVDRVSLHLVEISPALSSIQAKNLCVSSKQVSPEVLKSENSVSHYREGYTEENVRVFWYHSIQDVPKKFSVFLAHEFFDALPIHKFQKTDGVWKEVLVDIDTSSEEPKFRYVLTKGPTPASTVYVSQEEKRDHVEVSPQTIVIIDYLASFLKGFGGFALIADYGHNGEKTDTFRAFKKHKQHDPLVEPGTADLTADVDFSAIKRIGLKQNRLLSFGPISQCRFLKQMGIDIRLEILLKNASKNQKTQMESRYHLIMDEDKMGTCFKFFSFFPRVLEDHLNKWPVAGFGTTQEDAPK